MRKVSDLNTKKRTVASFLTEEELRTLQLKQQAELQRQQEEQSRQNQNNGGVLGGVGYALEKVGLGLLSGLEGIWDYTAGGLAKLFGADDWAEQQISEDWLDYNHADDWFNPSEGWKVAGDVAGGIGTSLPSLGAVAAGAAIAAASGGTLAPLAGMAIAGGVAGLGSAGRSTKEAYDKTGELTGNEFGYGALVGLTEGTMEGVSSLIGAGSGTVIKNMTKSFGKEVAKSATRQTVIKGIAKGFAGEAFEEGVQAIIEPYYKRLTYDPNAQNATVQEVAYAALVGGLSGAIMGGADVSVRNAHRAVRGNSLVQNGKSGDVISMAEQISNYQAVNGTDYQSFQLVQNTFAELQESLKKTNGQIETVKQKMLVGVLEQANTNAAFAPIVTTSAETIYNNADVIAAKLNELGYTDSNGKPFQITAEQLKDGIDTTNAKTLRKTMSKALKTNSALRTLAVADAVGKLMLDTAKYKDATLLGKQLSSQADLNRFIEQATDAERQAIAEKFGIDNWETITNDVLQSKITEFVASGGVESYQNERSLIQETESVAPQTAKKTLPRMVNLKNDGIYRYTQGSTDIAVIKRGDEYYVYDYESKRMSKLLSRTETNKVLREIHTNEANYTESVRQHNEVQNKLKEQAVELDNYARENITDYKNLSANGQASIRAVIRQGRSFGLQEDFILSCARVSARSGLSIVYSMEESFVAANGTYADGAIDLVNNRIIINPAAKSRTGESILIHELTHAIYNTTNGKLKIAKGVETMTNTEKERIRKRYAQVSKGDVAVIADEINAHFAEQTLSNKNILERLVEKNPNVKKSILDFFKKAKAEYNGDKRLSGASARLYRQYKKLFDEFSMRNHQYLGVENVSSDAQAQAEDLLKRNNIQLAIKQDVDGDSFVEVDSQNNIIDESPKQIAQTLAQIVRTKFSSLIDVHGQNIGINQRTAKEWLRSKSAEKLLHTDNQMFLDKISAFKNADELLKVSKDYVGEVAKHARKDNFVEFARGVVAFKVGDNGYEADIIVGTTKSKAAILYDIVNIQYKRIVADTTNTAQDRRGVVSTTISSISKNSENVNPHEKKLGKSDKKRYVLSETDSNGKQLSDKQYEFFKNTAITDKYGNLLVLYHQTDADFTVFDPLREGAGTRDSETPHGIFMKPTADDIGLSGSKQMPLYANIQKPLRFMDRTDAQRHWRANIKGYGEIINQINANDVKYNEQFEEAFNLERLARRKKYELKNLDKEQQNKLLEESERKSEEIINKWEAENEILEKQAKKLIDEYLKNSEYDGVILESDRGSMGRRVRSIIALHPNQVKSIDNVNPSSSKDIRFALQIDGETVTGVAEETKNLIALHNLSEEKLLKVLELGGFPMPSIAITKADMEHSDFGNITIVFGKETIDPQANTANKVYTGDAWTPIVPQKEYLLKDSALVAPIEHLKEKLNAEYSGYYHDIKRFFDQYKENNGEYVISEKGLENIGNVAYNNTGMLAAYLIKQRKKAEPQFTERYYNAVNERFIADELASIVDRIGEDNLGQANEYAEQEEIAQKYFDDIKSLFVEKKSSKLKSEISFVRKSAELSIQEFDIIDAQEIVRMLSYDYLSHGAVKEYDHYATREKLQKSVDVTAFYEWVKTIFTDSVQAVGMDNNSDIFDRYGNRRSFKQRHSAYTLNGIITAMKARKNIGNGFIVSENELAARLKKSFKSIEDIRNTRDILKRESDESYTQTRKMSADMLQEIVSSMTDSWEYQDNAREVIGELADKGYTSATKILSYLNKEYKGVYTFSANTAQKIELLFNVLQKYPTTYFEAKPQRAVYLDEIKSILLPSSTSKTLTEMLGNKNIPYKFYNEQENRTDIIKKMDSVKFALPKKDSAGEKSYGGYSVGQRAKFSANNTAMRVYTKAEAREIINSIIEERLVFDDKGLYGELSGKDIKEVTDYLFAKLNTVKEGYRGNAALKIADFIIDNTVLTDMINDSSVSEAMSTLSILRRYMHRLDLKGIKGEIENRYDKKNNISLVWGAKEGGIAPDTLPQLLADDGIVIESINESDIFFEMLQMYNNAKAKVNEKTKQIKLSEIGDAKALKDLRQQIARDILLAYDNKGSKSKYAKLVEKYTAQIARLRTELRESNTQNKLINSIIERAQKMRELKLGTFLNASEYKSDVFKQSVETLSKLKYRGNFNISGTRKVMADLKTWYTKENPVLTDSYEQVIADMLDTLSIGAKNYTTADLQMINDVMSYFTNYVEKFNKVYRNGKWIEAIPEATRYIGTIHDNEQVKSGWLMKHVGEPYMQTLSDPMSVVRRMDKYENGFYTESLEQLREASIDSEIAQMEVMEDYEAFLKKNKNYLAEATKQTVKYRGTEIPKIQLIGLYMTLKRNHAIAGLAENGFAFTDNKGKRVRVQGLNPEITEESDLRAFAIEEQLNIAELLSNTDKEYIAILEKAYNQDAKNLKAERDMQRLGFTNATEDYYYPIRRGNIAKNIDVSDIQSELDRVSNASFNKDTVRGSKQELYIESADIVFNRHVKAVCRYAKLSPAIDTFNRLYNLDISGNPNKPVSVATESANTWVKGNKYFSKLISDIQGIPSSSSEGMKALGYIRGSYAKFQLGANPKVWLTQLSSLFASSSMLDVDSISRGMFVSSKDIDTYCPIAKLRNNDNTAAMAQGVLDKVGKVSNVLMSPIGKMDRFVVRRLFGACQIQVSKKGGAKIGTTANKVEAGKLLKNVILETQQNSIATERSAAMRSGNELLRTITMFTADSMKVVGRVIDAVGEYSVLRSKLRQTSDIAVKETLNKRIKAAKKKVGKSITALVTSALFMASIAQLFKWLYDKDRDEDETATEEILIDFAGNLIGGLPIFKDIYARLVEGYSVENYAYSSINDLLNSTSRLFKGLENIFSGNATEQEISSGIRSLLYSVGQIFGIPTRNIYNVFYGLTKRLSPTTAYKIDEKFYKKNYVTDLNKAIENDDTDMVAMLMSMTMNQRIGNIDMSDTVRNKLTELYGKGYSVLPRVIGETITYKNTDIPLTEKEYNRVKAIYALALNDIENLLKNNSFNNLSEEKQAKAIKQIYDAYYNNALTDLGGVDERTTMGELSQWIDMSKLAMVFVGMSDISSAKNSNGKTVAGSKKKNVINYLLKQNLSDGERLLILCYHGYSIQDGDYNRYSAQKAKSLLLKYIFGLRTSQEQKAQIAQKCGFRVRNGKIIRENY